MDFQSAMETFAEAWVAANTQTPLTEAAEAQSLAAVQSSGVTPAPTGGGTASSGGGGASGVGGQPGAPRAPSTPPPSSTATAAPPATHGSPEDQDRSSSSCEALAPPTIRPPPPALAGKTLPVHCVVERVPSPQSESQQPSVEVDSYAIVPSAALFVDLVRTALTKLGYSPSEAICAKGVVQIKNWKPLSFDQITELPEATVGDMLSDLVQVATLRIRLYSIPSNPDMWTVDSVKTAVIQLLKEMSQSKLAKICPLKQSLLSTIVNNKFNGKLGAEKCKEFGRWFMDYRQSTPASASAFLDEDKPPQDGRMTFHSSTELPRMREWYRNCPHPTNLQLQDFVNQLNCGPLRVRNKPKVALGTLKNWWKNERQRERRLKRHASGDEDSSPGSSTSSVSTRSKSASCPIPVKLSATTATPGDRQEHPSPPAITDSPVHPHPQAPSQPPQPPPPSPPVRPPLLRSPPLRSPPPPQPPLPPPPPSLPPPVNRPHHPEHDASGFASAAAANPVALRRIQYIHYPHFAHVNANTVPPPPASPGEVVMAFSSTPPS